MINNTYISLGDRGMWKKRSSKNKKDTSILNVFMPMADTFILIIVLHKTKV